MIAVSYWSDFCAVSQRFLRDFTLKPWCGTIRFSLIHLLCSLPWTLIRCFSDFVDYFTFGLTILHMQPLLFLLFPCFIFVPVLTLMLPLPPSVQFLCNSLMCSLASLLRCDVCWFWFLFFARYVDDLMKLKAQTRAEGNEFITWNDIQSCVDRVNIVVHEEHESKFFCSIHARFIRSAKIRCMSIQKVIDCLVVVSYVRYLGRY